MNALIAEKWQRLWYLCDLAFEKNKLEENIGQEAAFQSLPINDGNSILSKFHTMDVTITLKDCRGVRDTIER